MKRLILILVLSVPVIAQETVTLTTPVARPSTTVFQLERLQIDFQQRTLLVEWRGNNNEPGSATYDETTNPTGAALIKVLNTANLSTNSLVRRIYTRLQTDGHLPAGTVSGTPQ